MPLYRKLFIIFAVLATMFAVYDITVGPLSSTSNASAAEPSGSCCFMSMVGDWHQTSNGIPNTVMNASITEDKIEITLTMRNMTGVFWTGTFDTTQDAVKSFKTVSEGNVEMMKTELYASSERIKEFSYENGDLSYQFSIGVVSTTVHLSK